MGWQINSKTQGESHSQEVFSSKFWLLWSFCCLFTTNFEVARITHALWITNNLICNNICTEIELKFIK